MVKTNSSSESQSSPSCRTPPKHANIQYNFCKNPVCSNFGVTPPETFKRGVIGSYAITYGGRAFPLLKCNLCGETPPMKSNIGIHEETQRLIAYLEPTPQRTCSTDDCVNQHIPIRTKGAYRSYGTAKSGAARYQCTACRKTFSTPKPSRWQRDTHHNQDIFRLLVNKMPLSRIVTVLGISWSVLYHRIDFIHRQCVAFAGERELRFKDLDLHRLYIAIDRQDHVINWTRRKDKRNVTFSAVASADNDSGYVFGVHPNYDAIPEIYKVEAEALLNGDASLPAPWRRHARLWLEHDYVSAAYRSSSAKSLRRIAKQQSPMTWLQKQISKAYKEAAARQDVEVFERPNATSKLPTNGFQVHAEYTMIAHFHFLKHLLGKVGVWRFYMDQESGIRSAFLSAFQPEVKLRTAEGFYVRIAKDWTIDEKLKRMLEAKVIFKQVQANNTGATEHEIKLMLLKAEIAAMRPIGQWKDKWLHHPIPTMSEPDKAVCWLTEHNGLDDDNVAWLYNRASLHAVDVFFEKVRRSLSPLERSIKSSANAGRVWSGYAPYDPAMVGKLLDIFRVAHNFIDVRKNKGAKPSTAAMRIGLADAPVSYGDVVYFK
ncbi:hypothetical protein [Methylotenera sp.]|uniref:hypothetical protein n=1 Tax=Methylotenera sp. TaxID=2051956 RepID=UPI00271EB7E1|nr:hypothetical protein [Methylotenera sp.]MDO9206510.1 hypothetical protein [Methylotenera sp.]